MKKYRVYADTSVFGGCFDDEFSDDSNEFFDQVKKGIFKIIISPILLFEINDAPQHVQKILNELPEDSLEYVESNEQVNFLRDQYISTGVLNEKSKSDAEHVATASVFDADFVISWNFKHIVHFDKIKEYQDVNLFNGYKMINIYSPKEVI